MDKIAFFLGLFDITSNFKRDRACLIQNKTVELYRAARLDVFGVLSSGFLLMSDEPRFGFF